MNSKKFCIITPSYFPDFERCSLLSQSVERFVPAGVNHYIIVPRKDFSLFQTLQGPHTQIIRVEDLLPWWIQKVPVVRNGWINLKTGFVRNWILQQIVKISSYLVADEDTFIFIDSDVAFVRPLKEEHFFRDGLVKLYCLEDAAPQDQILWYKSANKLLGLPIDQLSTSRYISGVTAWRRENVLKLLSHIESISGHNWIEAISKSWYFSEYVLYGVFVEKILSNQSGHFLDSENLCYEYWSTDSLEKDSLELFLHGIKPNHVSVMFSAKAGMSVDFYKELLEKIR